MGTMIDSRQSLPAAITKASSKQTYYTIRLFVDRERVDDAYRAYGYFRWVDDILDASTGSREEKIDFVQRQRHLLEASYRGEPLKDLRPEEEILVELVQNDTKTHPGLRSYLDHMMSVMEFDVERSGATITQAQLDEYSHTLAVAVTDALFYFIGQENPTPNHPARYHAVMAAHVVHMLRDMYEDIDAGYYNIPSEHLQQHGITSEEGISPGCREWVCNRIKLARQYFRSGRAYISQVKNFRCRFAGFAYAARFEWVVREIERDHFCLRKDYSRRKSIPAFIQIIWSTLASTLVSIFRPKNNLFPDQNFRIQEL